MFRRRVSCTILEFIPLEGCGHTLILSADALSLISFF